MSNLNVKDIKDFTNLPIGTFLTLSNKSGYYILYGYNLDKSCIACFPYSNNNSINTYINENLIHIPTIEIESANVSSSQYHNLATSITNLSLNNTLPN